MKINIILPEFGLSGGVMVALRYAKALSRFGHDVVCYAKKLPYLRPKRIKDVAHIVHRIVSNYDVDIALKQYGPFMYKTPLFVNNKTIRDADITIATAWCTALDVYKLSIKKGEKVYFIQGHEIWDDKEKGILSYKCPMNHIVIAKWIDDILVNDYGCKPGVIINNGVDLKLFKQDLSKRNKVTTIAMMHHFLEIKGIPDGLRVLDQVHMKFPDIKIIMFGKNEFINRPDYIEYFKNPVRDEIASIYQQSDIFVCPARAEGWGLTIVEAMACGCAVAGTKTGALLEIGNNGENSLISEPGIPEDLFANVERLILEEKLRKKIGKNAIKSVQRFGWDKSYQKFEKTLMMWKNLRKDIR
jgi:glycosyltransferase involved in cell wall biosynthesis